MRGIVVIRVGAQPISEAEDLLPNAPLSGAAWICESLEYLVSSTQRTK